MTAPTDPAPSTSCVDGASPDPAPSADAPSPPAGPWRAPLARLDAFWRRRRGAIVSGVVVGVAIHVLLLLLRPWGVSLWLERKALDAVIYGAGFQPASGPGALDPAFLFVDIDDATLERWPQVPYTPRDQLASLLRFAREHGAAAVLVDVNLTRAIGGSAAALSAEDRALVDELRRWPAAGPEGRGTLLVLNREFRRAAEGCRPARRSFLEDALGDRPLPFRWGSVEFLVDADRVVRSWRLVERACGPGGEEGAVVVPSAQLRVVRHLQARAGGEPAEATAGEEGGAELGDRIVYGIPWRLRPGETRPTVALGDRQVPVLTTVPAWEITEAGDRLSGSLAEGRVVVIGGSAEEGRDLVSTPLGEMPGALVLVNSIYSLGRFGPLAPASHAAESALALVAIVAASLTLAAVHGWRGYTALALATAALFVPLSLWALRGGHWVDWSLPLLAIVLHHVIERIEEAFGPRAHAEEEPS